MVLSLSRRLGAATALLAVCFILSAAAASTCKKTKYDVCVVGAGGAGAYTAVKLKQLGLKVIVFERSNRVGGHCETWTEPNTGMKIETGVIYYCDVPLVTQTFQQWNVTLVPVDPAAGAASPSYVVARNGSWLGLQPAVDPLAFQQSFGLFYQLMATRFSFIETDNGAMPDFDLLPADTVSMLLSPFGQLLDSLEAEFGSGAFAPLHWVIAGLLNVGPGPVRDIPALLALRNLRPAILQIFAGQGYTVQDGCSALYDKWAAYLGDSVKYNVEPFLVRRMENVVQVTYKENGTKVMATCRKMVVSGVQSYANMRSFIGDMDANETEVFSQVTHNIFSKSLVRTPLTANSGSYGIGISLDGFRPEDMPVTVGLRTFGPLGVGLTWTVGLTPNATAKDVSNLLYSNLTSWAARSGGVLAVPRAKSDLLVDGPDLHEHTPRPSNFNDLPAFYKKLYALQGYRNMYYTGALLSHNAQYDVWRYSDWLVRNVTWSC